MIRSLTIEGYRCFERFTMHGLGHVNLLVGINNSGKTSVLEAVHLLASRDHSQTIEEIGTQRGELVPEQESTHPPRSNALELDVRHLFYGREVGVESEFRIQGSGDNEDVILICSVPKPEQRHLFTEDEIPDALDREPLILVLHDSRDESFTVFPLTKRGGLVLAPKWAPRVQAKPRDAEYPPVHFVATDSLSLREVSKLWSDIALTPQEDLVTETLRAIEPAVERFAYVPSGAETYASRLRRGGVIVKLEGSPRPVPLGSMGDGMWRILSLAIVGIACRNGVILIDEIDTGLHFTVMQDMWRMIGKIARDFNVQVFATTHSRDCVQSLASICREGVEEGSDVTMQRINSGRNQAVPYSEQEIIAAANQEIEVR